MNFINEPKENIRNLLTFLNDGIPVNIAEETISFLADPPTIIDENEDVTKAALKSAFPVLNKFAWNETAEFAPLFISLNKYNLPEQTSSAVYTPTTDVDYSATDFSAMKTAISLWYIYRIKAPIVFALDDNIVKALHPNLDPTAAISVVCDTDIIIEILNNIDRLQLQPLADIGFVNITEAAKLESLIIINRKACIDTNIEQFNNYHKMAKKNLDIQEQLKVELIKLNNLGFNIRENAIESVNNMIETDKNKATLIKIDNETDAAAKIHTRILNKPISIKTVTNAISKLVKRLSNKPSANVYAIKIPSFKAPSRRDPNDPNLMGKATTYKYMKDLHIYLDTSGSINESLYENEIRLLIELAKHLNMNVYFNSFSHRLSQTTKLRLKGLKPAQIYNEFRKIPKVSGGTNFCNIWNYINEDKKRRYDEISIVITDFLWTPPRDFPNYPPNIYYVPINNITSGLRQNLADFTVNMKHLQRTISSHILI